MNSNLAQLRKYCEDSWFIFSFRQRTDKFGGDENGETRRTHFIWKFYQIGSNNIAFQWCIVYMRWPLSFSTSWLGIWSFFIQILKAIYLWSRLNKWFSISKIWAGPQSPMEVLYPCLSHQKFHLNPPDSFSGAQPSQDFQCGYGPGSSAVF